MVRRVGARVPKRLAERVIRLLDELKLRDTNLKICRDNVHVYIPLRDGVSSEELGSIMDELGEVKLVPYEFPEVERPGDILDFLSDRLPPHLLASLPRSFDIIGDVAVVEVPPELEPYKSLIGEAIMRVHRRVRLVLAKAGAVSGVYRIRRLEPIAGSGGTETVHREYGCVYHLDVAKVYFSPRLAYEHRRVAGLVAEGETVVDMFAGVGPFAIQIAKSHEAVKVYAIDINPDAIHYLRMNVAENKVEDKVVVILGDARDVIRERLAGVADRAIMNLPEKALEYVDAACTAIRPDGGIIHYYEFAEAPSPLVSAEKRLRRAVEEAGRRVVRVLAKRLVREVAPYKWQVVVDAEIR